MRAIIYTRVSNDKSGRSTSTADQERECRTVCEQRGWPVAEVLCDNDIGASRWSGKGRPEYRRLTQVLEPGDVLVTWEASRAQRDVAAYVQLRDLCTERGVAWCYSGRLFDLSDGDDRFGTGLDALLAEKEAEQTRVRVLRGKRAAALSGKPCGRPPYGYRVRRDPDTGRTITWVPDPVHAPVLREAARRLLTGETLYSICQDFTARKIPHPSRSGRPVPGAWVPRRLGVMIVTPSYAGLRVHQGEVIGEGSWEGLVTVAEHQRLVAILTDPARSSGGKDGTARHLLSGIARCGVCGEAMRFFDPPSSTRATYMCSGRTCVRRRVDLVEALVTEALLARLEAVDPTDFGSTSPETAEALQEARDLRARLDEFTDRAADGELSAAALARVEAKLLPKIRAAERRSSVSAHPVIARAAGPDARAVWSQLAVADQRALVRATMAITIQRSTVSGRDFNPGDVDVEWLAG